MTRVDGASAVRPGLDLAQHARALHQVHDAVMAGSSRTPDALRPLVSRSWSRVLDLGLDPTRQNARDPAPVDEIERRRRASPLHLVVDELRAMLSAVADASHFIIVVSDADGVILWREGAARVLRTADSLGFAEGATWTEDHVGTNAIGTAIAEAAPVQLFSAEHFEQGQHPWYCSASPVHDPRTGELLGVVDVSGPAMTLHPAIAALIVTATRLAEARLWQHHEVRLERLRAGAAHVLATTTEPLLLVDEHGWVAHRSGVSVRDRVAAPVEGRLLTVPGLGACLPERLGEGWLIRRGGTTAVTAHLGSAPDGGAVLRMHGHDGDHFSWSVALSPRHAALLRMLHAAGPAGLTSAALSRRLFGDDAHQVTVRAEISRLKRVVGSVVSSAPYRISPDVVLALD